MENPIFVEDVDSKIEEYWDWIAVALFLLTTVDMITTIYAVRIFGIDSEVNPFMEWILEQGIVVLGVINLVVVVAVVGIFYLLIKLFKSSSDKYKKYYAFCMDVWIGLLVSMGLFVFSNNLLVIFFKTSLFNIFVKIINFLF